MSNPLLAFRSVHPDFRSRNGYVWPFPGGTAQADGPFDTGNMGGCPSHDGDGICLATTAAGAASGGIPLHTVMSDWTEHWNPDDPLFDPEDDRPYQQDADFLHLLDDPDQGETDQ